MVVGRHVPQESTSTASEFQSRDGFSSAPVY